MPPGPVPRRSEERRRHGEKQAIEIEKVDLGVTTSLQVEIPSPDPDWHPVAQMLWSQAVQSGQSRFYEPSDWAALYLLCETISRDFNPVPIVVRSGDDVEVLYENQPIKGASMAGYLKAMNSLLFTEGDRRRLRIELSRPQAEAGPDDGVDDGVVHSIDEARRAAVS